MQMLGPKVWEDGCPVCKELCCCGINRDSSCNKLFHCYKKCPAIRCLKATERKAVLSAEKIEIGPGEKYHITVQKRAQAAVLAVTAKERLDACEVSAGARLGTGAVRFDTVRDQRR